MKYSKGYKYQLKDDVVIQTALRPDKAYIIQGYIFLGTDGKLFIYRGYAWNGATLGIDLDCTMLGVLVHDALFQLMQESGMPLELEPIANEELQRIMICEGAPVFIASIYYFFVNKYGGRFATRKLPVYEV